MPKNGPAVDPLDPSNMSAFAVYKNLIPGVKSFEDTTEGTDNIRSRKKNKRQRNTNKNADAKSKPEVEVLLPPSSSKSLKKKKKNKKRKLSELKENDANQTSTSATSTSPISTPDSNAGKVSKKKKTKKKRAQVIESSSESLEPPKKKKNIEKQQIAAPVPVTPAQMNGVVVAPKKKKAKGAPPPSSDPESDPSLPKRSSPRSIEFLFDSNPIVDSSVHGKEVFEWLIHPMTTETFFADHWEKKPLHLKRTTKRDHLSWLMSSATLDDIMRKNCIKFGKNIDITSYVDGVRETHNPEGRALPAVVWDYYSNGNSVRFLNPQTYIKPVWRLNASLQEYLGTFVGANVYLTPPDSQGFAPHYDDIEAFVLQIEGYKQWKLYKPRKRKEELPRFSSKNFNEEKDKLGEPILDVVLGPGDLLYFPRGTIHQAKAIAGEHSLHITISAYQMNSYADFLSVHLPIALEQSIEETLDLRRGLPIDYLSYMGIVHSDRTEKEIVDKRNAFQKKIKKLAEVILNKSCDLAADQLGKKLIWDSLPPYFTSKEKRRSVYKDGEFIQDGTVLNRVEIGPDVEVKLVRRNACRLLLEEGTLRLYFNQQNSMEYHGEEPAYLDLPETAGPAVEFLFSKYPEFVAIEDIPLETGSNSNSNLDLKIQLCADLWEKGILLSRTPLSSYPFDETAASDDEMEDPSDSSSSEEVSPEEEEDEEDRAFIDDDEDKDSDEGVSGGDFINDEASEDEDDAEMVNLDSSDNESEGNNETSPPFPVKRKHSGKFIL